MEVSFKLDASKFIKKLKSIDEGYANFDIPLAQVKQYQLKEIDKQFTTQGSNITSAWKPLKASTVSQRIRSGFGAGPILRRTGKLKASFKQKKLTKNALQIGSDSKYYEYHQIGGSKIPQRQIVGHSATMVKRVVDIVSNYINRLILNG